MKLIRNLHIVLPVLNILLIIMACLQGTNRLVIAGVGICVLCSLADCWLWERRFMYPMRKLEKSIQKEEEETESVLAQIAEEKEAQWIVGIIQACIDRSASVNQEEIYTKQTQLTALQSQINPHFLYNTLDTIRGRALIDDNREVAGMIETLSSFFRYSISRKGNKVTLRDELKNIQNYMKIMQYRFGERYQLEVDLDEDDEWVLDSYVPRLILQPIVENAVIHGLEDKLRDGCVTIDVTVADDLILTVSDNGKGMSIVELDNINARIHSALQNSEAEDNAAHNNTGIGLPNIHKRIELLYGHRYGLHVYSSIGQGTDVEILLPIDSREE